MKSLLLKYTHHIAPPESLYNRSCFIFCPHQWQWKRWSRTIKITIHRYLLFCMHQNNPNEIKINRWISSLILIMTWTFLLGFQVCVWLGVSCVCLCVWGHESAEFSSGKSLVAGKPWSGVKSVCDARYNLLFFQALLNKRYIQQLSVSTPGLLGVIPAMYNSPIK